MKWKPSLKMFRVDGAVTVRWPHLALGSILALGAFGLMGGAAWIAGIPTYTCDEGISPSGWIYAGFALFALALPVLVFRGTLLLRDDVHRYYVAAAMVEAAISVALALYLGSKYGHYQCG